MKSKQTKINFKDFSKKNDYFVQINKFTMLDRTFIEEVAKEQNTILDGKTPAIEMAKIGVEISADFILVGSVEDFKA